MSEQETIKTPSKKDPELPSFDASKLESMKPKRWRSILFALIFLCLFLLTPAYFIYRSYTIGPYLFGQYYEAPSLNLVANPTDQYEQGMAAYIDRDYEQALLYFKEVDAVYYEDDVLYMKGMAQLGNEQTEAAITNLQAYLAMDSTAQAPYYQSAQWYLSMAHLQDGDCESAMALFSTVREQPTHDFYEKAGEVLDRMR